MALTGLQTLDLRYGGVGAWCGVWACGEGVCGCAVQVRVWAVKDVAGCDAM
jgi:hypothetical protein